MFIASIRNCFKSLLLTVPSRAKLIACVVACQLLLTACNGHASLELVDLPKPGQAGPAPDSSIEQVPLQIPVDTLQPWETGERRASSIDSFSDYTVGRDWFSGSSDGLAKNGEAARLTADAGKLSYGIWRLPQDGIQPGTITADINLLGDDSGAPSTYYMGIANYGSGRWEWQGPFGETQLRLTSALAVRSGANYLSPPGNCFVCVLVHDGNSVDVVGLGTNSLSPDDTSAPPQAMGLVATPVSGGLELVWNPVIAADLAGYRISYANHSFVNGDSAGVRTLEYLQRTTRQVLALPAEKMFIRVCAIDHSGNAGPLSEAIEATALSGALPQLLPDLSAVSGLLCDEITLQTSGAAQYDVDLDGDGQFESSGNSEVMFSLDTCSRGVQRVRLRGRDDSGAAVSVTGASAIVIDNTRPVAVATASPQFGSAPLEVEFSGSASDLEDDAASLSYAWDLDGDGIYDVNLDTLTPPFHTYADPGLYSIRFRVTDSQGASDVDTLLIQVNAQQNILPVASQESTDSTGSAPLSIDFDASGSFDPDGSIVNYEWDFDGNGTFEESGSATTSHIYPGPGIFSCRVKVSDDMGGHDFASVYIEVVAPGTWVSQTVGQNSGYGLAPSIAIIEGRPALSYYHNGNDFNLMFVRATDSSGSKWGEPIIVVDNPGFGGPTSLAVIDGNPAICWQDDGTAQLSTNDLWYVRATDSIGESWSLPVLLDQVDNVGDGCSLTQVDGVPAISYADTTNHLLKFVRGIDSSGSAWNPPQTLFSVGSLGHQTTLIVVNGNPAINYYDSSSDDIMFIRSTDASGISWGIPLSVDGSDKAAGFSSMAIIGGFPAVSYYSDDWPNSLKFVIASDVNGNAWETAVTVHEGMDIGKFNSLSDFNGKPAISYWDNVLTDLMFIEASDALGTSWDVPVRVDAEGYVGRESELMISDGKPCIGYVYGASWDQNTVKYAVRY